MKTIKEIRDAFLKIHNVATGHSREPYMSIPANRDRDADCIVSDAIDDLERLRNLADGDMSIPTQLCPGYVGYCNDETGHHWSACMICNGGINGHECTRGASELIRQRAVEIQT